MCFNQFQQPCKKLDDALSILFNLDENSDFENIEKEIHSKQYSILWEKIKMGLICYQLSSTFKADHFEINSPDIVLAFILTVKNKKTFSYIFIKKSQFKKNKYYIVIQLLKNQMQILELFQK